MAGSIVSEPLNPHSGFNWVFLVELLICGILTVFFLFYFNRLVATLISYGIRAYTWHAFHAYIDIQALQVSLLGGRLFFKDIRYHGHNETILVHGGYITWNYWLRRVRDADVYSDESSASASNGDQTPTTQGSRAGSRNRTLENAESGGKQTPKKLPCRISIKISGVEAFMYNRSPAYDGIIEAMRRKANATAGDNIETATSSGSEVKDSSLADSVNDQGEGRRKSRLRKVNIPDEKEITRDATDRSVAPKTKKDDPPSFLGLLPVHIDCNKGAIVVGNENTPSVITAQFEKANGEFDAAKSGPLDVYQQIFNFQFTHPVIHMKPNPDFKSTQMETAARLKHEDGHDFLDHEMDEKHAAPQKKNLRWTSHLSNFTSFRGLSGIFSTSTDSIHTHSNPATSKKRKKIATPSQFPGQERWKGLTRYLDDNGNDGRGEWDAVEYALSSLIADCPCINVSFYWDVTGPKQSELDSSVYFNAAHSKDINGSAPPEYGMDIQVYGGIINYGPWTDRQRAVFQSLFFPGSHVDGVPATPLSPGDLRVLSVFKLFLSIEDDTVLRIPTRESSKDWKWKGKAHTLAGQGKGAEKARNKPKPRRKSLRMKLRDKTTTGANVRPFAWIDIKVASNSSVNYVMDMVASETGYQNRLEVDLSRTEISSSVNHGLLWRSGVIGLDCDLSNPLSWNSLRKWMFNITCRDLELFLLRDHLFLLTDLVADWGSGPSSDYFNFVPFQYLLNINFLDFKLYLNTNDSNIVNNPSDLDDNNFIILYGQRLHGDVTIPLDQFKPLQNEIRFDVQGHNLGLEICMPSKNTLNTFVRSKNVASLGGLTLSGSHTYVSETSAMNTDRLFMDIQGDRFSLELFGWVVHHFMKIKDNYFGEDMHFRTLEEFQGLPSQSLDVDATTPNGQPVKVSNDLDVILSISAEAISVLLPANLYSAEHGLRADIPFASADLRFTNYYMDLMVNFSPIGICLSASVASPDLPNESSGQTEVFIDSVAIFGHRLFGLPPTEPTYVCNWDFEVGKVSGECTPVFIERAAGAARSFAFTFEDDENTLSISDPPIIHDSTFVRLKTQDIHVWFHIAEEAVLVSTGSINMDFNDLAGDSFSQRMSARIPDLTIGAVDAKSASRHRTRSGEKHVVETHAFLQTTLSLNMLGRKLDFTGELNKQQAHMKEHDQRTHRTRFMFLKDPVPSLHLQAHHGNVRSPAMQFPDIPHPIFLVQPPGTGHGSYVSSGYHSEPVSTQGQRLRAQPFRCASTGSFASSIRSANERRFSNRTSGSSPNRTLLARSLSRSRSPLRVHGLPSDEERKQRNLPPSSVALSSSLATPYFPLDQVLPDLSDVPSFPNLPSKMDDVEEEGLEYNDVSTKHLDESYDHTSLLISAEPGIRLHCTPEALRCVATLINLLQPYRPEDLLDEYQVNVMTKILDHQKRNEGKGKSLEFSVRVPFIHVRLQNEFTNLPSADAGKDQYDIILNRLKLATRIKKFAGDQGDEDTLSLHTTLGSLGISVTERSPQGPVNDVAVQAEITDLLVWTLKGKEASVNISFRAFEGATTSRKMEYMGSLIHRTALLGNELVTRFEEPGDKHLTRLRYLAWYLTTGQERVPDPAFLTKASYALRAAKGHLRSHDSWKILSRFRYIWQSLPEDEKAEVLLNCSKSTGCPKGAEERIITMWDQWRTWDLAHVKKSLAMITLFGSPVGEGDQTSTPPLYLDIRSQGIKFIIDPGPKQSEVWLHILAVNIAVLPPPRPTGLMLVGSDSPKQSTTVQLNTRQSSIRISWEMCELVEVLLRMFQKEDLSASSQSVPTTLPPRQKRSLDRDFHFVYVTDKAELSVDMINLRALSTGQRFQFSLAGTSSEDVSQGNTMTALIHLEEAGLELFSRSRLLLRSHLEYPSLYLAHRKLHGEHSNSDEIKVAGASRMIKLLVEEDLLGIIEVVDHVLRDEVAYIHHQIVALQKTGEGTPRTKEQEVKDKTSQLPNITLALFMEGYLVEIALLQSLTWSIAGSSGRISVVPALGRNVTLSVDFDLAAHTHRMRNSSIHGSNIISSLELPPANGRVTITNTSNETRIWASAIIDTVNLQASEIQALVATINKPEITSVVHAIKDDIGILQSHIEELFPKPASPVVNASESARNMLFRFGITLSGLNVLASAPGQLPDSPTARLALRLASIQIRATNISPNETILVLPEAIAHLREISVEMTLSDSNTTRRCGNLTFGATFQATAQGGSEPSRRIFRVQSSGLQVNIFADTASAVVDVLNHLQDKIKDLDLSKEKNYLRRLRQTKSRTSHKREISDSSNEDENNNSGALFKSTYQLELLKIQVSWIVGTSVLPFSQTESEDLVLSFRRIDLSTRKGDAARLTIEDMQLQMVPVTSNKQVRSRNSALLPEVVFNVAYSSTGDQRKMAFHAAGKSLDLRLDSRFILPANVIERSIALAGRKFRTASTNWNTTPTTSGARRKNPFGNKRLASLLVDASFAGAVVHINGRDVIQTPGTKENRSQPKGRYSQFVGDGSKSSMVLRAPGVALKVEYKDDGAEPSLNAEIRVDGSSNTLFPTVVPLLIDISESIKEAVQVKDEYAPDAGNQMETPQKPSVKLLDEENLINADPSTILGGTQLNLGLLICKQEFSLSCQPIARVAAIAKLEDLYVTVNSVKSQEHGHFFAASAAFQKLEATVQHVYSRESTFGFNVDSIVLSLMNSKHLSGTSGISAILKINPMALQINGRQLQDFLLFREIWIPPEIRQSSSPTTTTVTQEPQEYLMQRYQQVTAATAFPWNANISIANVSVELDLGQAIGKSSLNIHNLWASSKKSSTWEQNLCIGIEKVGVESSGRASGFVELSGIKVRTSISWPSQEMGIRQTPLVQASLGFRQLRVKAGFDYQAFLIADIANFDFLMYNVREQLKGAPDRLVAILDGDKVHVFCTATSAAQGLALFQALERLVQENQQAYKQSLKDIEKFLRRKSSVATPFVRSVSQGTIMPKPDVDKERTPISLHTDVVVTLRSITFGIFPSTFVDTQILMLEAADAQARFAVALEAGKIHSGLGMTLGQLSVALSHSPSPKKSKPVADLTVDDIVSSARSAKGGTILRVPKVVAGMHTWQVPKSAKIDYIFKSSLEGKVDVGWNYSRISYIRTMWSNHSRTLASRLGKPLPESNIKITSSQQLPSKPGTPVPSSSSRDDDALPSPSSPTSPHGQEKITAEVKLPQSRYEYTPLELPLIETPQLRDMGEATPPLEWIGLHRDRLPNVTHQIVIVSLLEVAREVEEAYERILGSS